MKLRDRIPGLRVSLVRDAGQLVPYDAAGAIDTRARGAIVARAFIPAGDEREHFLALCLCGHSRIKGVAVVSVGTLSASLVHTREVFRPAIVAGAAAVVLAHNHPSGDCTPSAEDKEATRRMVKAGELLGVPVLDHVILGAGKTFFSFKDRGLL